jgi:hypothetical protein
MRLLPNVRGGGNDRGTSRDGIDSNNLDNPLLAENDNLSDDDNAQIDLDEQKVENEDPLLLAIDDLEGRVVAAIDDVKLHPGIKTGTSSVHDELASLIRPVLEVAAHTGPSVARTYYRGTGPEGIEASVEEIYERTVSDLTLPVMLEIAQSDTNAAKRASSLEFFRNPSGSVRSWWISSFNRWFNTGNACYNETTTTKTFDSRGRNFTLLGRSCRCLFGIRSFH